MSRQDFLTCSGLEGRTLEIWLEQRWIIPEQSAGEAGFSDRDVARARLIQELIRDFGVNHEGVDVILHLTDQLHGLRLALSELRKGDLGRDVRRAAADKPSLDPRRSDAKGGEA